MRKKVGVAAAIAVIVITGIIIWFISIGKPVLVINGEKIYQEEYDFLSKVSTGVTGEKDTDQRVILMKLEQQLLNKNGVVGDISYDAFINELNNVNQEREKALENGSPIYGPSQYSEKVYYDYKYSEAREVFIRDHLMQDISDEEYDAFIKELGVTNETSEDQLLIRYQIAQKKYQEEIALLQSHIRNRIK